MTINERIKKAIKNFDGDTDNIDKIIALAYYIGREDATKELSDKVSAVFSEQKKRVSECRYHNMAMNIQGDIDYVYSRDYAQDMTALFASDETNL